MANSGTADLLSKNAHYIQLYLNQQQAVLLAQGVVLLVVLRKAKI